MSSRTTNNRARQASRTESLGYLHSRIREEAEAAVKAVSLEATLAHVHLATAYAQRICKQGDGVTAIADAWVDHHRVW